MDELNGVHSWGAEVMIQVTAQVMSRDDSSGGWVPVAGGGLSLVALQRFKATSESIDESWYKIVGHRQADDSLVLDCTLRLHLQYIAANPTFHHWQTANQRYGLTFQSAVDGRAFERSIHLAVQDMLDNESKQSFDAEADGPSQDLVADDDIFMMLHFDKHATVNGERPLVHSCSDYSERLPLRSRQSAFANCRCPDCVQIGRCVNSVHSSAIRPTSVPLMQSDLAGRTFHVAKPSADVSQQEASEQIQTVEGLKRSGDDELADSSYVRFAKNKSDFSPTADAHEYCYPTVLDSRKDVSNSYHAESSQQPIALLSSGATSGVRGQTNVGMSMALRRPRHCVPCIYCGELFDPKLGRLQKRCRDAPDRVMDIISIATCTCVADAVAYHCFADNEGDFEPACSCSAPPSCRCVTKWILVLLLSLILPCLCCFWPLVGCRRCAATCGCCTLEHRAV